MATKTGRGIRHVIPVSERDARAYRLRTAWNNLSGEAQKKLWPAIDDADRQLGNYVNAGVLPDPESKILLYMKSFILDDLRYVNTLHPPQIESQTPVRETIEICLGNEGQIVGTGRYQTLDIMWTLECGTIWLENLYNQRKFPDGDAPTIQVGGNTKIVIASDFGTGNFSPNPSPSVKIATAIQNLRPDYTIHLGDVYYAATEEEEVNNLVALWPKGALGSFTLNSNHEMYSGGFPYFNLALKSNGIFAQQQGFSYFALESPHWIIVGLDSAYKADKWALYKNGSLGVNSKQFSFLKSKVGLGKKIIVLTHHNSIPCAGQSGQPLQLFSEVMSAFPPGVSPSYWFYGHEHIGAVYYPLNGMLCRCVGHSALPWGNSSELRDSNQVAWYEHNNANDPDDTLRVLNGFVLLELNGSTLGETFYDENGVVAWPRSTQADRQSEKW